MGAVRPPTHTHTVPIHESMHIISLNQGLFKKQNLMGHSERDLALISGITDPECKTLALSCLEVAWALRGQIDPFLGSESALAIT